MDEAVTTRKSGTPIKVYCLPEEKALIAANARVIALESHNE